MYNDINNRISYIKNRVIYLVDLCEKEITQEVSNEVRNVTQDILTNLNRMLDIIMSYFYDSKIKPKTTEEQNKKYEKNVFFPVCNKPEDLKSYLGGFGASNLEVDCPEIFNLVDKIQPYNSNEWIRQLRDYSNLGHRKIVGQRKNHEISLMLNEVVKVKDGASAIFKNCLFREVRIKELTINKESTKDIDPRLNPRIEIETLYLLEDSNINVITLCQKSLQEIEKLFKEISYHINN